MTKNKIKKWEHLFDPQYSITVKIPSHSTNIWTSFDTELDFQHWYQGVDYCHDDICSLHSPIAELDSIEKPKPNLIGDRETEISVNYLRSKSLDQIRHDTGSTILIHKGRMEASNYLNISLPEPDESLDIQPSEIALPDWFLTKEETFTEGVIGIIIERSPILSDFLVEKVQSFFSTDNTTISGEVGFQFRSISNDIYNVKVSSRFQSDLVYTSKNFDRFYFAEIKSKKNPYERIYQLLYPALYFQSHFRRPFTTLSSLFVIGEFLSDDKIIEIRIYHFDLDFIDDTLLNPFGYQLLKSKTYRILLQ